MSWLDGVRHRLRTIIRPGTYEAELREEMRLHVELDAAQQGDAARARRRFGNMDYYREETRRQTWWGSLDVLRQDGLTAWRSIRRAPGVSLAVVATLALGIGANATAFTVFDRLYVRAPAGVEDPSSLRRVWVRHHATADGAPLLSQNISFPTYRALAEAAGDAAQVAVYSTGTLRLGARRHGQTARGAYASANYFDVLGVRPALGRFYSSGEDALGTPVPVAVVSHGFWQRRLGGDSTVLGRTIEIGRMPRTIIGVAERSFAGLDPDAVEIWLPVSAYPESPWRQEPWWQTVNMYAFRSVLRLPPGVAEEEFARRATALVRRVNRELLPERADTLMSVHAASIIAARGPGRSSPDQLISTRLSAVAVLVLLVAAANVMNLLLARAVGRRRETVIRLALGISRSRLVRLLVSETMLLASIAAAVALIAARWGGALLRSLLLPDIEWADAAVDARVALFTFALAALAGLVAGIVPALQSSRPDLSRALKDESRSGVRHRSKLRAGLVITQAALSVTLLLGAALFVRSLRNVQALDIGYDPAGLVFGRVLFDEGEAPGAPVIGAAMRAIAERLNARPGVAAARASMEPMRGAAVIPWYAGTDSTSSLGRDAPFVSAVSPGFFTVAGVRMLRGRDFTATRTDLAAAEVIVSEGLAGLLWPGRDPLGRCMHLVTRDSPCYEVVGVVENVRRMAIIEESTGAHFYVPLGSVPDASFAGTTLIVRSSPDAVARVAALMRAELRRAFPTAEARVSPMLDHLEPQYRPWRLGAVLFTAFGLLALLVSVTGIYTTVWYGVSQRTHEFGVRTALGARVAHVLRQVLGESLRMVAFGTAIGIALALAGGRFIASLLYRVEPHDPAALLLVATLVVTVAALAALVPAWRATRVDPLSALRAE